MFLIFLKILVPFLIIFTRDSSSIQHFIKIFVLRILPSFSKLLKRRFSNKFCEKLVAVDPENLNLEIFIGDCCAKNSQKNKNVVKLLQN